MHRAIEPRTPATRQGLLRYAIVAAVLAAVVVMGWSLWAGSAPDAPATDGNGSVWLFGVAALLLVGACAAAAGHFHARLGLLEQAQRKPEATTPASADGIDTAALTLTLRSMPGPAWLFTRDHEQAALKLWRCNEAADALLRDSPTPKPADWAALAAALPAPLQQAVRQLAPGQSLQHAGWSLRLEQYHARGGPGATQLLVMLPAAAPAGNNDEAAEQEAFSYTVSHDLRAPIRVVEGFTRILKEDYGRVLDRIGNDHLDRVLGAAARMNSMIDALLALSALSTQPLARQPVNLSQLAGFIVDDLKRESCQRTVEVEIQPGLMAHGDPTLLRMVLENLLGNAWKYTGKCGSARISFGTVQVEGREVYVVRDNGAGFDMRFADRLFGVFQRLHSANDFQGTGVGLASVRRIVRRHGGEVWAESEVGQGAAFYFTLPSR
ncbi:sensor histidine kinase [Ideonella sp. BN130291]|uniref:sensor histidine kinase n=1 Tax=Ideonella sp. BN130291 TaxID=3112940 RepID=UPI002E2641B5|nr:ATP-binding protein [Ideonella sp. BN130291]